MMVEMGAQRHVLARHLFLFTLEADELFSRLVQLRLYHTSSICSRSGCVWCCTMYHAHAKTLFLITTFRPSRVRGMPRFLHRSVLDSIFWVTFSCHLRATWVGVPMNMPRYLIMSAEQFTLTLPSTSFVLSIHPSGR